MAPMIGTSQLFCWLVEACQVTILPQTFPTHSAGSTAPSSAQERTLAENHHFAGGEQRMLQEEEEEFCQHQPANNPNHLCQSSYTMR